MKKLSLVVSLVALAAIAGCSSSPLVDNEAPEAPVELGIGASEPAADPSVLASESEPTPGEVIDSASLPTTLASNESPAKSPVNLGASSAGRAH